MLDHPDPVRGADCSGPTAPLRGRMEQICLVIPVWAGALITLVSSCASSRRLPRRVRPLGGADRTHQAPGAAARVPDPAAALRRPCVGSHTTEGDSYCRASDRSVDRRGWAGGPGGRATVSAHHWRSFGHATGRERPGIDERRPLVGPVMTRNNEDPDSVVATAREAARQRFTGSGRRRACGGDQLA